jgi:hypothetical protein
MTVPSPMTPLWASVVAKLGPQPPSWSVTWDACRRDAVSRPTGGDFPASQPSGVLPAGSAHPVAPEVDYGAAL